ncbi:MULTISPECIES: DUF3298 and DUF4163 domain-containing protein [Lysobacteraceae]|uniref:DUF3298 and DUF4163 domain-containing protein n=1 Tax=Lysobacteraceae TaxID=32033 RepID=UPI001BCF46A6|nr:MULTISPECIES: DUF3298 and DUF4163 domain-containing protein [Lysobacter]
MTRRVSLLLLPALLAVSACQRQAPAPQPGKPAGAATSAQPASTASTTGLADVVETTPRYVIGISYPPEAAQYPGLAAALKRYAEDSRKDLMDAVGGLGNDTPTAPYELSVSYTTLAKTPAIVAVGADGYLYTGGAHAMPLIARFVWLPQRNAMLTADALVPQASGWQAISDFVREQLHTALSQRIDADDVPAAERADMIKNAGQMIDEGTAPTAESFSQFEPVMGSDGRIAALRFVFPPYQVGPYADGKQTVDVPADALLPHIAPAYRSLFRGG